MPVTNTSASVTSAGNGVKVAFDFAFKIFSAADVVVKDISAAGVSTVLTLNVDYTVVFDSAAETGTVTLIVPTAAGANNTLSRNIALQQTSVLPSEGLMPAKVVETALDKLTLQVQDLQAQLAAAIIAAAPALLQVGTFAALDAAATTVPFVAKVTDYRQIQIYLGDRALGANGWTILGGY